MKYNSQFYILWGLLLGSLFMLPYLILGTGSIVTYHDQLDGELLSYTLTAKYLFTGVQIYPELLHGIPANGMVPPAPLFVIFYKLFPPFVAFMLSQWCINLVGFAGMCLLLSKLLGNNHSIYRFISFSIAVIFMMMPFYPVYGLCIPGLPLMSWAYIKYMDLEDSASSKLSTGPICVKDCAYLLLIFIYGLSSSLVLIGFAVLGIMGMIAFVTTFKPSLRKYRSKSRAGFGVLLIAYLLTNLSLLKQVLFPETGYVSHKSEIVISPQDILSTVQSVFSQGVSYAMSYHTIILVVACLTILLLIAKRSYNTYKEIIYVFLSILAISLFCGLYHSDVVTALRNQSTGVVKEFNLDRVAWLLPVLWCVLAAYVLRYIFQLVSKVSSIDNALSDSEICTLDKPSFSAYALTVLILGIWAVSVLLHSSIKPNLAKLVKTARGQEYYELDWKSFFAEDIFSQIDEAIGKPKDSYHVLSVGIYPVAATYNGFYCLDGYSNNYPVTYKHEFREIIAGELEKSEYVRAFFDDWGNRCYVTTAEQANYYTFEKKWNSVIYDLDLNYEKLKELDCQYVFSAAYIMNAEENGLSLLQEAPFETEGSWYHIYVYQVQ